MDINFVNGNNNSWKFRDDRMTRTGWKRCDRRTDGQTDGRTDGQTDERTNRRTDGRTDGRTERSVFRAARKYECSFHWNLLVRLEFIIIQHWFRIMALSWLVYLRIYASTGLNELTRVHFYVFTTWASSPTPRDNKRSKRQQYPCGVNGCLRQWWLQACLFDEYVSYCYTYG